MNLLLRNLILLAVIFCSLTAYAALPDNEQLSYKITYRWGLVNKTAGRATFILRNNSSKQFTAKMYAQTEPWADHFYKVRDTLISTFDTTTGLPILYKRIAHEGGSYAFDQVTFTQNGDTSSAKCIRLRRGKSDKQVSHYETSLSAQGDAVDLLSSFYYLRNLKFLDMKKGETKVLNIFSGKRKEILKITYNGPESLKIDDKKISTFLVTFTFTSDSGKTTSKPIKAWLSLTNPHIPMKLVGELKIGRVECIYTDKQ